MERQHIEPGLLPIFKVFSGILWILLLLGFCSLSNGDDPGEAVTVTLYLIHMTLLLLYLRIERFQRWFGRYYLPLALVPSVFVPFAVRFLAVIVRVENGASGTAAANDPTSLILWLFPPLVVVAVQYGFRAVILFVAGTAMLEILNTGLLLQAGGPPLDVVIEGEIGRALIFLTFGYIISRLINEQRSQRNALQAANRQIAQHAVTLEQLAISQERNRMARDLHDTLAHTLSAVSIQLEAATTVWETSPERARQVIERTQEQTRSGLNETRRALQALRASPLEDMGLVLALKQLAEQATERLGSNLVLELPDETVRLAPDVEQNVYRIAEEALNNAVKHAEPTCLRVSLRRKRDVWTLQVADDGIGFNLGQTSPDGHYGVSGMQERAKLCQGVLQIHTYPGSGTTVEVNVREESPA